MNVRLAAEKLAAQATQQIGIRWGETFPFYYVAEYPKSGGTWLARMVSDYLQIPFPQHSLLPPTFRCLVQHFGRHHPRLQRVLYIYRDGRDVMTSLYFDRLRVGRFTDGPGRSHVARTYEKLLGRGYDPADIARHMPRFLEFEFAHPGRGSPLSWRDHVADWYRPDREGRITYLSYEDLLSDCAGTLGRALERLTGGPVDRWRLQSSIEKMSMQRQTGRQPGQADPTQHIRKGVVGDWRNHFTREAAELFHRLAGDTLVALGYEEDGRWVDRYVYPSG